MKSTVDKIIDDLKNHKENLSLGYIDDLKNYTNIFVQRWPSYGIKPLVGRNWRRIPKPLSDPPVLANLLGKYVTGSLARWYPSFFGIDVDNQPREFSDFIRESLRLDESNSMLYPGERPNCWKIYGNPTYTGKPLTSKLLQSCFKSFAKSHQIEIFPQGNNVSRLPFGPYSKSCDPAYYNLETWQDDLYWFNKLDDVDISQIPGQQLSLDLNFDTPGKITSTLQEGKELFEHGLQYHGSRNDSQYNVLYYLWRLNIPHHQAVCMTWKWINEKHNGFSKEILCYPRKVKGEIDRQAAIVYEKYEYSGLYPDSTNNLYHGWLTEPDIREIFKITRGNMPKAKFLYYLLKYSYPRRHRDFIGYHSKNLIECSSTETYLPYLNEFESMGVLKRGSAYSQGEFSKSIKLNWKYGSEYDAILDDGRSVDTLDDINRFLYKPPEFMEILRTSGAKRTATIQASIRVYFKDRLK